MEPVRRRESASDRDIRRQKSGIGAGDLVKRDGTSLAVGFRRAIKRESVNAAVGAAAPRHAAGSAEKESGRFRHHTLDGTAVRLDLPAAKIRPEKGDLKQDLHSAIPTGR